MASAQVGENLQNVDLEHGGKMVDGVTAAESLSLTKPIVKGGRFQNPWKTWSRPSFSNLFKFIFREKDNSNIPAKEELDKTLPILTPDVTQFNESPSVGVRAMWIGHATVIAQFDGITVMTDPVFGQRCGPGGIIGSKRYRNPPCRIEELPKIDAVVISHTHYDHLDRPSVVALNRRFGKDLWWFVPMGLKTWMQNAGCENVTELSWWEESELPVKEGIKFVSTPCQHWCKRNLTDDNKVLWCSWSVFGPKHSFFFAGDTGYCEGFKEIGAKFGSFSLAAIPIGAYEPNWFMKPQHVNPEEAVNIHNDINAKASLGIHWGTFKLTYEHYLEPKVKLAHELENRKMSPMSFITLQHGETKVFESDN